MAHDLEELIEFIDGMLEMPLDAGEDEAEAADHLALNVLHMLAAEHGAVWREGDPISPWKLDLAGLVGLSRKGPVQALRSWQTAARRHLGGGS
ncbi:hypothetical protein [Chelativorans alearense]|uniref:hypothetical protein n=1 Tax=Chelativorans alearense TaxID=2681495 RepID=UPI0013D06FB3|nr:hypothetical protein [Chelativorans alearense]